MTSEQPFFSVLIPTKNKEEYIGFAITSILKQTFQDFEIIVTDNSTKKINGIIAAFNDRRIKYFQAQKPLMINDNWNFALSKASGRYIIMIGDDDYLMPECLQDYYSAIQEFDSPDLIYNNFANFDYAKTKLMVNGGNDGKKVEMDRKALLKSAFDFKFPLPGQSVSCFSNSVCKKVTQRLGAPYNGAFPDFFAHCAIIAFSRRIIKINKVNVIFGRTKASIADKQILGKPGEGFDETFKIEKTPLSPILFCDGAYETMLALKRLLPEFFDGYEINTHNYFAWASRLIADQAFIRPTKSLFFKFVSMAPIDVSIKFPLDMMRALALRAYLNINIKTINTKREHEVFISKALQNIADCADFLSTINNQPSGQKHN